MTEMSPKAYICSIGMINPVGENTAMCAASIRAGLNRFRENNYYNKNDQPMKMALLPNDTLPPLHDDLSSLVNLSSRQQRLIQIADPAIKESVKNVPADYSLPLYLAGPESIPNSSSNVNDDIIEHITMQTGLNIDVAASMYIPSGRAGGIHAVGAALQALTQNNIPYALIGGIDTYLDLDLLSVLDSQDRINASGIMDGFIPSEGACFILLAAEKMKPQLGNKPIASITLPGFTNEPGHRYSEEAYQADGLAEAFARAIQNANVDSISTIWSSLNGEYFGGKEYGVAVTRNQSNLAENMQLQHPADSTGDIGAAFGTSLISLASINLLSGYTQGSQLVYCSSDGEHRAATCVNLEIE